MAYEADRVVVELLAKVDQFDQPVKQSATQFNRSMDQITTSATKAEAAVVRSSGGRVQAVQREQAQITQFTRSLAQDMIGVGDLMLSDRSPFVAPVKQAPAVTGAVKAVGAGVLALGGIMETVAGVGVALLIAALIEFIAKSRGANAELDEMVQKLKEQHDRAKLSAEAQRLYDQTVEGSIDSMAKLTAEIAKQNLTLEDNIALQETAIATALTNVSSNIGTVSTQLATAVQQYRIAVADLNQAESGNFGNSTDAAAAVSSARARVNDTRQQVADLTGQLIGLNAAAENGAKALRSVDFPLVERNAKNAVNPIAAINQKYDDMATKAKRAGTYTQELANSIERMRAVDLKTAQQANRATGSGEFGRRVSFADAADIASRAGLNVTSAYRSTADQARLFNDPSVNRPGNPVARPGTSAHEGVNGKWALDIAFAPGLTAQSLKKLYGGEGVSLSAVFKERGHFHIEGSRTQAEISADRDASRQAAADQRALDTMSRKLHDQLGDEQEVTVAKEGQAELSREILGSAVSLQEMIEKGILPSLKDWDREYEQIIASQEELNHFGEQLIDDVLNPDNWRSWGSIGKTVLRDLEGEFLRLAAINPLKNLLFGQNNPTLGSIFSLFGGGGGGGTSFAMDQTFFGIPGFAVGGRPAVGQVSVVGENGPELFVPDSAGTIVPSNARAASPWGSGGAAQVIVGIEASEYFDGRVVQVTGPVMARVGVASANGGAGLARRNLSREAQHRLEG